MSMIKKLLTVRNWFSKDVGGIADGEISIVTAALLFTYLITSQYSYLLFHSIAEIFSIIIVSSIFVVAINSWKRLQDNAYLGALLAIIGIYIRKVRKENRNRTYK